MDVPELLFVGSGRWVTALDRFSGRPVWRRKLPRFFSGGLLTLAATESELYVSRGGYVYSLDTRTGEVLWERGIGSAGALTLMALPGLAADHQTAATAAQLAAAAGVGGAESAGAAM